MVGVATVDTTVGAATVRVKAVVLVMPPPVALTVTEKLPVGVDPLVVILRPAEHVGVQEAEEKEAVAPEGRPETPKVTDCVAPESKLALIEVVTEPPAITDLFPALLREKSNVTGLDTVKLKVVERDMPPAFPVTAMGNVPAGVELLVITDKVEEHDRPQDEFEKDAFAPLGSPETKNETGWLLPDFKTALIGF